MPGGVGFRFSLLPEPWLADADPDAVAGVVLDIVAAAGAGVPQGGEVIVGTRHIAVDADAAALDEGARPGDYVRVTVRDSGNGLAPDRLDRVFDPERSGDPAICAAAALARRLGGFARVESALGIGTAVHLFFRRSPATAVAEPEEDEQPARAAE